MATSGVRLTFKFNFQMGLKITGWSESYDLIYANIPQALANLGNIQDFIGKRLDCLGAGVVCVSTVLTADPGGIIIPPRARRATTALSVPAAINADTQDIVYNKSMGIYPADYSTTVLLFRAETDVSVTPIYTRSIWIAGIPDASDASSATLPVAGPWQPAFEKFANKVGGSISGRTALPGICTIRSVDRSGGNPVKFATGYAPNTRIFTVPAHGFQSGQLIEAVGFRATPGNSAPRGMYKVVFIDLNSFALAGAGVVTANIPPGGFRAVIYVWNAIVSCVMEGFSKRNKGRPFNPEVGRRRRPAVARA